MTVNLAVCSVNGLSEGGLQGVLQTQEIGRRAARMMQRECQSKELSTVTDEQRSQVRAICRFAFEVGHLKRLPRAGWLVAGAASPVESVADHSHRVSLLAFTIAVAESFPDPDRAATLGAFHDVHETRIGDIPHAYRPYVTAAHPNRITVDQTEGTSPVVGSAIQQIVAEFERHGTAAARAAHDADRLDCLFQALQYQAAGATGLESWVDSSLSGLRTGTARSIGQEALTVPPGEWHGIAPAT